MSYLSPDQRPEIIETCLGEALGIQRNHNLNTSNLSLALNLLVMSDHFVSELHPIEVAAQEPDAVVLRDNQPRCIDISRALELRGEFNGVQHRPDLFPDTNPLDTPPVAVLFDPNIGDGFLYVPVRSTASVAVTTIASPGDQFRRDRARFRRGEERGLPGETNACIETQVSGLVGNVVLVQWIDRDYPEIVRSAEGFHSGYAFNPDGSEDGYHMAVTPLETTDGPPLYAPLNKIVNFGVAK